MNTITPVKTNYNNTFKAKGEKPAQGFFKYCIKRMLPESKYYQKIEKDLAEFQTNDATIYEVTSYMEQQRLSTNVFYRAKERAKHGINQFFTKLFNIQ